MTISRSIALMLLIASPTLTGCATAANADVSVDIVYHTSIAPPPLPEYDQPPIPGDDYIWTPGYWAWDNDYGDYYWVPGAWVEAPEPGLLWTPGYWACTDDVYVFHQGYWGPHVGFYGGVVYGFGYTGSGYEGGYWRGHNFFYNTTVNNIHNTNIHITNVYQKNVIINKTTINRISYNGPGGVNARPTPQQMIANTQRFRPTAAQLAHRQEAHATPALFFNKNHGAPPPQLLARPTPSVAPRRMGDLRPQPAPGFNRPPVNNAALRPEPGRPGDIRPNVQPAFASHPVPPHTLPARQEMRFDAPAPAIRHEPQFHQMAVRPDFAPRPQMERREMQPPPRFDRPAFERPGPERMPQPQARFDRPMVQHFERPPQAEFRPEPRPEFRPQPRQGGEERHCRPGERC